MKIILFGLREDAPESKTKQELETLSFPLEVEENAAPKLVEIQEKMFSTDWFKLNPTIELDKQEEE